MENNDKRALKIISRLDGAYPGAPATYLAYKNAFEMLVATILSAHTADACVNTITPELFRRCPNPKTMMETSLKDLVELIRPCGTYNRKSEYIQGTARMIVEDFSGEVPRTMEDLVRLPGVSRKTANVVLSVVFNRNEGIVVDTHVMRVSGRLGLTYQDKNRDKAERELMEIVPREQWYEYARLIGAHGRRTCSARKPNCDECSVRNLCPSRGKFA
ncbi:MAG: endonuclease III [Candidatus Thorarchaeota archaeon]|nr:MAG: endonuclease III [Candidatus Thorarchaeota archaeon]